MAFAGQIKEELLRQEVKNHCCARSELCGLFCFGGSLLPGCARIVTERKGILQHADVLLRRALGIDTAEIVPAKTGRGGKCWALEIKDAPSVERLIEFLGQNEMRSQEDTQATNAMCCKKAYVKGAFLGGGSMIDPEKNYHLEFVTRHEPFCHGLAYLFAEFDLHPKVTERKANSVLYFKGSDEIEDCLNLMGAHQCMMELFNVRILKDKRNEANRQVNCDTANMDKTIEAAAAQLAAIETIKNTIGLSALPPQLYEIALLRLEYPDAGLRDLGEMLEVPISKSGVNHRMKRIQEVAEELRGEPK